MEQVSGWIEGSGIQSWLSTRGFDFEADGKPERPKEGIEAALRMAKLLRSSALYRSIAEKISLRRCTDPAFIRLRLHLLEWLPR